MLNHCDNSTWMFWKTLRARKILWWTKFSSLSWKCPLWHLKNKPEEMFTVMANIKWLTKPCWHRSGSQLKAWKYGIIFQNKPIFFLFFFFMSNSKLFLPIPLARNSLIFWCFKKKKKKRLKYLSSIQNLSLTDKQIISNQKQSRKMLDNYRVSVLNTKCSELQEGAQTYFM